MSGSASSSAKTTGVTWAKPFIRTTASPRSYRVVSPLTNSNSVVRVGTIPNSRRAVALPYKVNSAWMSSPLRGFTCRASASSVYAPRSGLAFSGPKTT